MQTIEEKRFLAFDFKLVDSHRTVKIKTVNEWKNGSFCAVKIKVLISQTDLSADVEI